MPELPPPPPAPNPTPVAQVQPTPAAAPGLPNMRGRLILMATLAAVSVYGAVTGPLEASPTPAGSVTEVAAPSTTAPAPAVSAELEPAVEDDPETALESEPVEDAPVGEPEPVAEAPAPEPEPSAEPEAAPEPTAPPADTYTGPVQTGSPFVDAFDAQASHWRAVNGSWAVQNGVFVQSDPSGFDLINELMIELPETYNISVRMHAVGDVALGGGIIVGMETTGSRRGAYLVDFTAAGEFLRWGRYDVDTGIYKYLGGLAVGTDVAQWHTLRVKIGANESTVFFNGDPMGTFDPVNGGHAALVTSESSVEFDDLLIEVL